MRKFLMALGLTAALSTSAFACDDIKSLRADADKLGLPVTELTGTEVVAFDVQLALDLGVDPTTLPDVATLEVVKAPDVENDGEYVAGIAAFDADACLIGTHRMPYNDYEALLARTQAQTK